MPRPGPARPLVNVRLTVEEVAELDAQAARLGVTRSDVIRAAIESHIRGQNRGQEPRNGHNLT